MTSTLRYMASTLQAFAVFGQGQHFYQKSLLIFESLFLDFLGSFFRGISVIYRHIRVLISTYRYAKRKKYEKIPQVIIFKRVLKLFRLKNLSFQKKIYVEIVKKIWIMLKLLRIGYFVKYVTDGIAQDSLDFIFLTERLKFVQFALF